jgi:hypothetical protein
MDNKHSHLNMLQGIINRLSNNSFLLKGWSVVLVSAMFALAAKDSHLSFIYLAYFPAISFWLLDAYFLWQERLFRKLYDHVREMEEQNINYSMDVSIVKEEVATWPSVAFSKTIIAFHGVVILTVIIVMLISLFN